MKNFLVVISIILVYCSCETELETPDDAPDIDISNPILPSPELLDFYYFPVGSYWIYKRIDTSINIYDTVRIIKADFNVRTNPIVENAVGIYRCFYEHTYYKNFFDGSPLEVLFLNTLNSPQSLTIETGEAVIFDGYNALITFPFDSISISNTSSNISRLINKRQYLIQNETYKDVLYLHYGSINQYSEIYMVKNIGLLKYILIDDLSEWELVSYKIL